MGLSKNAVTCAFNKLIELEEEKINQYVFSKEMPKEVKARADTIIEKLLIEKLEVSGLNILSEERGLLNSHSKPLLHFIIEPIGGTVNFVTDISSCSISVALYDRGLPAFSVFIPYPSGKLAWDRKKNESY